jgi:hypothetical protein
LVRDTNIGELFFELLLRIPDDITTLFVRGSLDFILYALFIPELTPPYEPVGAIAKNGAVSSTLNLSIELDIFYYLKENNKKLFTFYF